MSITAVATGMQNATVGTEHTLTTQSSAGLYRLVVHLASMLANDVTELRVKRRMAGSSVTVSDLMTYYGVAAMDATIVSSEPVWNAQIITDAVSASLKQTFGTSRAYEWELLMDDGGGGGSSPSLTEIVNAVWATPVRRLDQTYTDQVVSAVWATPTRSVLSVSSPVGVASNYDKGNYTLSTVGTEGLGPFLVNAIWATAVRRLDSTGATQIADSVLDRNMGAGVDSGSTSIRTVRQALRASRNKVDLLGGVVYKEDDSTVSWTFVVASDSSTDRVTSMDPAGP